MNSKNILVNLIVSFLVVMSSCTFNASKNSASIILQDTMSQQVLPNQKFKIDNSQDLIIESQYGAVILLPKSCFLDENGEVVNKDIELEVREAMTVEEMILAGLNTNSEGDLLQTDGLLYINAKSKGKQLHIDKKNPIHIDLPTLNKIPGMSIFKGIRDKDGNMKWEKKQEIKKYLQTVDQDELDFLPTGFANQVEDGMPYKKYKKATKPLIDSLYYSLSIQKDDENSTLDIDLIEANDNPQKRIFHGKYTSKSFEYSEYFNIDTAIAHKHLDPAMVNTLKDKKFANSIFATREFEKRMSKIHLTCDNQVLMFYIDHLEKELSEMDSMAANYLREKKNNLSETFYRFAAQGLGKVKMDDGVAEKLKKYYSRTLKKVKKDLEKEEEKLQKERGKDEKAFEKVANKYKKILWNREKYRMEKYGYQWSDLGWMCVAKKSNIRVNKKRINVTVNNGASFDRVHTYLFHDEIKSLHALASSNKTNFWAVDRVENINNEIFISVGYKGKNMFMDEKLYISGDINLNLVKTTKNAFDKSMSRFKSYSKENDIYKDLEFKEEIYKENIRRKKIRDEQLFILKLKQVAFRNCSSCQYVEY